MATTDGVEGLKMDAMVAVSGFVTYPVREEESNTVKIKPCMEKRKETVVNKDLTKRKQCSL